MQEPGLKAAEIGQWSRALVMSSHSGGKMEKKELTKRLLGESFRNLLDTTPFEKITIHMITDDAGVIRPTFYHYFKDKYEVVEWLFEEEVGNPVREILSSGMLKEAAKVFFVKLDENRGYYRKIFEISGQNSFIEILERDIYTVLFDVIKEKKLRRNEVPKVLTDEVLASYYTMTTVNIVKAWVKTDMDISTTELADSYAYLLLHSVDEIFKL